MSRKNEAAMCRAVAELIATVKRLNDKVDHCADLCEGILDEVTPLGLALDELTTAAPPTEK